MSIKKTIGISVVFHVVLFSAALLFSAGLFKGSGNTPDDEVFFVQLAVENNRTDNMKLVSKIKSFAPEKIQVKKQKKKNLPVTNPPEIVKPGVKRKKAPEMSKDNVADNDNLIQKYTEEANNQEHSVQNDTLNSAENQKETVNTSLLASISETTGLINGSAKSGLSPSMMDLIGSAIERAKSYPMLARRRGIEGTVHVSFRVSQNGEPDEIEIKKSSGHSILDSATVKVVQKAAPYPLIKNRVEVPVAYRLRK